MKKHLVVWLVLLLGAAVAFAQGTPVTGKGTWGLFVETSNLSVNDVGAKYFINDKLAIGSGLYFNLTDPNGPTSSARLILSPLVEYHFLQKGPFSLSGGGFLNWDSTTDSNSAIDQKITNANFRLGGMVGVDWYAWNSVSLGARYRAYMRLLRTTTDNAGTVSSTSDTYFYLSPDVDFILTFHLK